MSKVLRHVIVIGLCLLALFFSSQLLTRISGGTGFLASALAQVVGGDGTKTVEIWPDVVRDAVAVVRVTEAGNEIAPGRYQHPQISGTPFAAGDDWIRNLSFTLRNRTYLNIDYIEVIVAFPEDSSNVSGPQIKWRLGLGQVSPSAIATYFAAPAGVVPAGTGQALNLGPYQEMTISLADQANAIRARIEQSEPFSAVSDCIILVHGVYFQNLLKWENSGVGYVWPGPSGLARLDRFFPGDIHQPFGYR